jgi:hypothetical protein
MLLCVMHLSIRFRSPVRYVDWSSDIQTAFIYLHEYFLLVPPPRHCQNTLVHAPLNCKQKMGCSLSAAFSVTQTQRSFASGGILREPWQ